MIFNTITLLALASTALSQRLKLKAVFIGNSQQPFYLRALDGDFHTKYLGLSYDPTEFFFENNYLYHEERPYNYNVLFENDILISSDAFEGEKFTFDKDNVLQTSKKVWQCMDINDPKGVSKNFPLVVFSDKAPNQECLEIKIVMEPESETIILNAISKEGYPHFAGELTVERMKLSTDQFSVRGKGTVFQYSTDLVWQDIDHNQKAYVLIMENRLLTDPFYTPLKMNFDSNGRLITNENFWACYHINDWFGYSEKNRLIVTGSPASDDCIEVTIGMDKVPEDFKGEVRGY